MAAVGSVVPAGTTAAVAQTAAANVVGPVSYLLLEPTFVTGSATAATASISFSGARHSTSQFSAACGVQFFIARQPA